MWISEYEQAIRAAGIERSYDFCPGYDPIGRTLQLDFS